MIGIQICHRTTTSIPNSPVKYIERSFSWEFSFSRTPNGRVEIRKISDDKARHKKYALMFNNFSLGFNPQSLCLQLQ